MEGSDLTARTFLVEHYWPGVTPEAFRSAAERVRASTEELALGSDRISFLHSTLVPEDEAAFCVFTASSPDVVVEAYSRAGVQFDRILDALELEHAENRRGAA
ncbi:MAG TPA: nickel-binding protein [Gaiellaceae bacterium]|nr:nickel-binding protein [Gaiellaceae bacterium]